MTSEKPVLDNAEKSNHLPDLGERLPDATIVEWFVKPGDIASLDEPLVSMETVKAVVEEPSPFSGKVVKQHGNAEHALYDLVVPIERVTGHDTHIPLFRLEMKYLPPAERIVAAMYKTMEIS